jgi:tetratricopeptide (TPR) repeat protein
MVRKNQSALLAKYTSMYKKNPRSRVFAPLAESYRKLGMYEEAFKILKDGIRQHPTYTLGYIVLSHCYFDQNKFELTYNTLRPIIAQNADNISLQKIFAQSCINLGYLEEALDTFKYLLFLNPKDKFFAEQVKRLEDDLQVGHKKLSLDQLLKAPDRPVPQSPSSDDDWVQVDFNQPEATAPKIELKDSNRLEAAPDDQWVMRKPEEEILQSFKTEKIIERSLEDDFYADEFADEGDIEEVNSQNVSHDSPIISHTLIDLYCSQHYYDKAIELLQKIIELNPDDRATIDKLTTVRSMKADHQRPPLKVITEEDGHDELISIIENKVKAKSPKEIKLKETFEKFLAAIRLEASLHT